MMQDAISTGPKAPRQGAALLGPQDLAAAAWRTAGDAAGEGFGKKFVQLVSFPLLWTALRVGPAYLWTDATGRMSLGVQSESEYRTNTARTMIPAVLATLVIGVLMGWGEVWVLNSHPAQGAVIVPLVLVVLLGLMIVIVVRQAPLRASLRALRSVKKLKPFFVVSCVSFSADVTRDEAVRFLHEVISARTVGGEYLRIFAVGEEQASFFESLGFQRLEGTWALIGQAPSVRD